MASRWEPNADTALYVVATLLSAFLLFQVQPMIAKRILPWFGGTPMVWSAVMLFFQVALTAGYAYAHWVAGDAGRSQRSLVHLWMLAISILALAGLGLIWPSPITPGNGWKPAGVDWPALRIVGILAVSVGLPYIALAANSPLMQAWYGRRHSGAAPYWLYALSNAGALVALLSYPVIVEPALTLQQQGWAWSAGYLLFAALAGCAAWRAAGSMSLARLQQREPDAPRSSPVAPSARIQALWLALSATGSVMLLAMTAHMTTDVAVIPFLWVLPLAVYLLTFVIAFSGEGHYNRPAFTVLLGVASVAFIRLLGQAGSGVAWQVWTCAAALFVACMVMHGELYRLRPDPAHLTRFYLMVSVGGALGGLFVAVVAPAIFSGPWELFLGWAAVWVLAAVGTFARPTTELPVRSRFGYDAVVGGLALAAVVMSGAAIVSLSSDDIVRERNFYGVLRVQAQAEPPMRMLVHGATLHGSQLTRQAERAIPTAYYWRGSGVGLALTSHPRYGKRMRVGVLGLGVGTLAAYGQPGDVYRFYEINPLIASLAEGQGGYFSFLGDSRANVQVVLGDARVSLERERDRGERQAFDILALDTFSSDAIPVHLLTREAFALYLDHLAPGGVIAAHISNRHLDLTPVLWQAARTFGLKAASLVVPAPTDRSDVRPSQWILLARDETIFSVPRIHEAASRFDGSATGIRAWTDDYSNLFQVLK